jgi:ribonuclease Z
MSVRKLVVLGTASQIPTRQRNQTGFFLKWDDEGFLIDPGEGTQRQMTRFGVAASSITKILISHFHGDHCLGLPGVIQRISLDRVQHPIDIFYPASGQVYFERLLKPVIYFESATINPHPVENPGVIFDQPNLVIRALPLKHSVDVWGFRIEEKEGSTLQPKKLKAAGISGHDVKKLLENGKIEINGKLIHLSEVSISKPGQTVSIVLDTRSCPNAYKLSESADLLICESTYLSTEKKLAHDYFHLTASQAAKIAQKSGVKKLVLSHFSQRYTSTEGFLKEAAAIHADVSVVNDGDEIEVKRPKRKLT